MNLVLVSALNRPSLGQFFQSSDQVPTSSMASTGKYPVSRISAEYKELEKRDPLLKENPRRWVLLPIQYPAVFEMYKKHEASFWTAEEIDLASDAKDWDKLNDGERHFIKHVLAFFAASDGISSSSTSGILSRRTASSTPLSPCRRLPRRRTGPSSG